MQTYRSHSDLYIPVLQTYLVYMSLNVLIPVNYKHFSCFVSSHLGSMCSVCRSVERLLSWSIFTANIIDRRFTNQCHFTHYQIRTEMRLKAFQDVYQECRLV